MDVLEAIRSRRSIGLVKEDPLDKETIAKIIEAGTWAPSHYRTEPWHFFVMEGKARKALGKALVKIALEEMDDPMTEANQKKVEKVAEKPFRAPVIIAVAVRPSDNPRALKLEEAGAVYAAIQNMLLAAHGLGVAGYWRTGAPAYHPTMKKLFGLADHEYIAGFLYFGYPKREPHEGKRRPINEVTTWLAEEDEFEALI
ncbi:nitroreductase [Alkalihalobacillus oceani]|uniref:nitroreductase family protein n=1 Tax=Halalkalibacter oceani TaxID=1653776 RepID=UPI00203F7DDA|nr:nitroreductase [Halalkalibacter oceani]MCM3762001.1 nitroreductase [Halalkalibacter oceani]